MSRHDTSEPLGNSSAPPMMDYSPVKPLRLGARGRRRNVLTPQPVSSHHSTAKGGGRSSSKAGRGQFQHESVCDMHVKVRKAITDMTQSLPDIRKANVTITTGSMRKQLSLSHGELTQAQIVGSYVDEQHPPPPLKSTPRHRQFLDESGSTMALRTPDASVIHPVSSSRSAAKPSAAADGSRSGGPQDPSPEHVHHDSGVEGHTPTSKVVSLRPKARVPSIERYPALMHIRFYQRQNAVSIRERLNFIRLYGLHTLMSVVDQRRFLAEGKKRPPRLMISGSPERPLSPITRTKSPPLSPKKAPTHKRNFVRAPGTVWRPAPAANLATGRMVLSETETDATMLQIFARAAISMIDAWRLRGATLRSYLHATLQSVVPNEGEKETAAWRRQTPTLAWVAQWKLQEQYFTAKYAMAPRWKRAVFFWNAIIIQRQARIHVSYQRRRDAVRELGRQHDMLERMAAVQEQQYWSRAVRFLASTMKGCLTRLRMYDLVIQRQEQKYAARRMQCVFTSKMLQARRKRAAEAADAEHMDAQRQQEVAFAVDRLQRLRRHRVSVRDCAGTQASHDALTAVMDRTTAQEMDRAVVTLAMVFRRGARRRRQLREAEEGDRRSLWQAQNHASLVVTRGLRGIIAKQRLREQVRLRIAEANRIDTGAQEFQFAAKMLDVAVLRMKLFAQRRQRRAAEEKLVEEQLRRHAENLVARQSRCALLRCRRELSRRAEEQKVDGIVRFHAQQCIVRACWHFHRKIVARKLQASTPEQLVVDQQMAVRMVLRNWRRHRVHVQTQAALELTAAIQHKREINIEQNFAAKIITRTIRRLGRVQNTLRKADGVRLESIAQEQAAASDRIKLRMRVYKVRMEQRRHEAILARDAYAQVERYAAEKLMCRHRLFKLRAFLEQRAIKMATASDSDIAFEGEYAWLIINRNIEKYVVRWKRYRARRLAALNDANALDVEEDEARRIITRFMGPKIRRQRIQKNIAEAVVDPRAKAKEHFLSLDILFRFYVRIKKANARARRRFQALCDMSVRVLEREYAESIIRRFVQRIRGQTAVQKEILMPLIMDRLEAQEEEDQIAAVDELNHAASMVTAFMRRVTLSRYRRKDVPSHTMIEKMTEMNYAAEMVTRFMRRTVLFSRRWGIPPSGVMAMKIQEMDQAALIISQRWRAFTDRQILRRERQKEHPVQRLQEMNEACLVIVRCMRAHSIRKWRRQQSPFVMMSQRMQEIKHAQAVVSRVIHRFVIKCRVHKKRSEMAVATEAAQPEPAAVVE